jgi:very-short-patch-repair endonuclease
MGHAKEKRKYCSRKCAHIGSSKKQTIACKECGKQITFSPSHKRIYCSDSCSRKNTIRSGTSIENIMEKTLIDCKIPYQKQVSIPRVGIADFLLHKRLIIECDGDYWHNIPKQKERDFHRDFRSRFLGYHTVRFSETLIHANPKGCITNALEQFICFLDGQDPAKYHWGSIAG